MMAFDLAKSGFGSRTEMSNLDKIKLISLDDIQKNSQNFYSLDGIDELAESIEMVGLLNPISVVDADGKYRLVSGHRRFEAYYKLWLGSDPSSDAGRKYSKIPAIVLRGMDDLKETFALITANSTARELTYSEKLQQEKLLRETLTAMKAAGMAVPRNLGQYIADQIGVSRNEVSRMNSVNKNLIPEAREKVDAGEMTAQQAYELSKKPEAEQKQSVLYSGNYESDTIQRDLNKEHDVLMWYVRGNAKYLSQRAGQGTVYTRQDGIDNLRLSMRNSGYGSSEFSSEFSNKCGRMEKNGIRFAFSWPTLWDALAIYAIQQLAASADRDDTDIQPKQMETGWQTGTPEESGEYVAIFDISGRVFKRICYYDNVLGEWTFRRFGTVIEGKCVKWFRLPDSDD